MEAAGTVKTTAQTVHLARPGVVVVQIGWPEENELLYDIATVMEKELDIRGLNRYANAYPQAIHLAASRRIDLSPLITHRFPFDQIEEAFRFVAQRPKGVIKAVVES